MSVELFKEIFTSQTPLLDVRAPIEFERGAFPAAKNYPILDNDEREKVGICYKQQGSDAAEVLGFDLVSGAIRQHRINQWCEFTEDNPDALLYCFRGGLRSRIAQRWLAESGVSISVVPGGYKAMRNYLLCVFDSLPTVTVLSGRTGVGKTEVIRELRHSLDLEGHANHRGSAFGRQLSEQPSQINFENTLAIDLLGLGRSIIVEDEGRLIGRLTLPLSLQNAMQSASIILLEDDIENRIERIFQEYIVSLIAQLELSKEDNPVPFIEQKYTTALAAIRKRLGGINHSRILKQMQHAFDRHLKGDDSNHRLWIGQLLTDYYDPMYDYQLEQKSARIVKTGYRKEINEYLGAKSR